MKKHLLTIALAAFWLPGLLSADPPTSIDSLEDVIAYYEASPDWRENRADWDAHMQTDLARDAALLVESSIATIRDTPEGERDGESDYYALISWASIWAAQNTGTHSTDAARIAALVKDDLDRAFRSWIGHHAGAEDIADAVEAEDPRLNDASVWRGTRRVSRPDLYDDYMETVLLHTASLSPRYRTWFTARLRDSTPAEQIDLLNAEIASIALALLDDDPPSGLTARRDELRTIRATLQELQDE